MPDYPIKSPRKLIEVAHSTPALELNGNPPAEFAFDPVSLRVTLSSAYAHEKAHRTPIKEEPGWGVSSVNYELSALLASATRPTV